MNTTSNPSFETLTPAILSKAPAKEPPWLIEKLWLSQACGIIGGEPKTGKSYLALTLAIAVASGQNCFRTCPTRQTGPVLLYSAEHHTHSLQQRLQAIASHLDTSCNTLPIEIIHPHEQLRLDSDYHRQLLSETIQRVQPKLVILDPLTRLHQLNENLTHEIAPLLNYLRRIQQRYQCALMLVHHTRKYSHNSLGQSLRGTSDLHAWGDSNLYLSQNTNTLTLQTEHRCAASQAKLNLKLHNYPNGTALNLIGTA